MLNKSLRAEKTFSFFQQVTFMHKSNFYVVYFFCGGLLLRIHRQREMLTEHVQMRYTHASLLLIRETEHASVVLCSYLWMCFENKFQLVIWYSTPVVIVKTARLTSLMCRACMCCELTSLDDSRSRGLKKEKTVCRKKREMGNMKKRWCTLLRFPRCSDQRSENQDGSGNRSSNVIYSTET